MPKFQFRADQFRAASMIAAKEDTRHYLNGVFIEPDPAGGIFLVATDGHVLVALHDPNGYAERAAILYCDFKSPALKIKRGESGRRVYLDGNSAEIRNIPPSKIVADSTEHILLDRMVFNEIDGTFPDWRRTVPLDVEPSHNAPVCFSIKKMQGISTSASVLADDRSLPATIFQRSPGDPMVIRFFHVPGALYVLVPMRDRIVECSTPDWLRGPVAESTPSGKEFPGSQQSDAAA